MRVYFGAGIQGAPSPEVRAERAVLYRSMIEYIQSLGHDVIFEHTATNNKEEVWKILEKQFGPLPSAGPDRSNFIRNRNIEAIEHMADAAIFEVSMPSLGVGIELAHAYLRPKMGLKPIPVLCLYQKDFWSHGLSIMVSGAAAASESVRVEIYETVAEAETKIESFLGLNQYLRAKTIIKGKLPEFSRKKIEFVLDTYCNKRIPAHAKHQIRLTYEIRGNSVTLTEERPLHKDTTPWTKQNIAQFRFDQNELKWCLFCSDRNGKWHVYQPHLNATSLEALLKEIDRDPTGIFWG